MPEYFRDQLYYGYFSYRICDILLFYSTYDRNKFPILTSMYIFRLLLNSINIIVTVVFRYNFHPLTYKFPTISVQILSQTTVRINYNKLLIFAVCFIDKNLKFNIELNKHLVRTICYTCRVTRQ